MKYVIVLLFCFSLIACSSNKTLSEPEGVVEVTDGREDAVKIDGKKKPRVTSNGS